MENEQNNEINDTEDINVLSDPGTDVGIDDALVSEDKPDMDEAVEAAEPDDIEEADDAEEAETDDVEAVETDDVEAAETDDVEAVETDDVEAAETDDVETVETDDAEAAETDDAEAAEPESVEAVVNADENEKAAKKKKEDKPFNVKKEIMSWIIIVVVAIGASYLVNRFVIINATVPSGSMKDTIMIGDRIIGLRFSYAFSDPERGDIIIFKFPDDEKENYVKRIIGLPGDKIQIIDGKIYINSSTEPLDEPYIKEEWHWTGSNIYEVPEDCYFMMGDNRNSSNDSRFWSNRYVKREKVLGKALFCYWPFKDMGSLK